MEGGEAAGLLIFLAEHGVQYAFFAAAGLLPIALIASLARGKGGGETAEAPAPAVTVTAAKPETAALSAAGPNTRSLS